MALDSDVLVVAILCGLGFLVSAILWQLLVRPERLLGLLRRGSLQEAELDGADDEAPHSLQLARGALGLLVFLLGLLAGAATAFLAATAR